MGKGACKGAFFWYPDYWNEELIIVYWLIKKSTSNYRS